MKRLLFAITVILFAITAFGQAPESFKYQTVVRNSDGEILVNQPITLIIDILQGSISGTSVCNETFYVTTNDFGLVNIEIGSHNTEAFKTIDWSTGPYFIKVTLNGTMMGTTELLSVPYSLFSKKSGEYLPPQMAHAEIYAIPDPANGMLVFCTDCDSDGSGILLTYEDGDWYKISSNCLGPMSPVEGVHDSLQTQITWNWNAVPGALGYKWNTTESFSTAVDVETSTSKIEAGLACNSFYTRYVWSYSAACHSEPTILSKSTAACTLVPCPDPPIVVYEGHTYNTVQIGLQCWLQENLDIGTQIDGMADPADDGTIEKYCFDDDPANCVLYGGLYQFHEMMSYNTDPGSKGICPQGWHIPTDAEWCVVSSYVDPTVDCYTVYFSGEDAGLKMKATSGWIENGNGNNESGFTAIPGGVRYINYYNGIGFASDIWTSTSTYGAAYYRVFGSNQTGIGRYASEFGSHHGFAVRCLKDE